MKEKALQKVDMIGTIKVVPLKHLMPDPHQPRQEFDKDELKKLRDSVEDKGIMTPITVEPLKLGKYLIIDGERRYRSACELNLPKVPVNILKSELSKSERNIIRFQLQETHKSWTVFEKAEAMYDLKEALDLSIQELSRALAITSVTCNRYLSILSFTPTHRKLLIKAKLPFTYIENLSYTHNIMPTAISSKVPDFVEMAVEKYEKGFIKGGEDFKKINTMIKAGEHKVVIKFFTDLKYTAMQAYMDSGHQGENFSQSIIQRCKTLTRDLEVIIKNKYEISSIAEASLTALDEQINKVL